MRKKRRKASPWKTSELKLIDRMIADLTAACAKAEAKGSPGLADLRRAKARAVILRDKMSRMPDRRLPWGKCVAAIVFVAEVVDKVRSYLSCFQAQEEEHASWDDHKAGPHCGGDVADRAGWQAQGHAHLPVAC